MMTSSANSDDEAELVSAAELIKSVAGVSTGRKPGGEGRSESESDSDSDLEMGFIQASQVKPDKITKAVRSITLTCNYTI
jgi:hypothetical protein